MPSPCITRYESRFHWRARSAWAKQKANFTCESCGAFFPDGRGLFTHHRHYRTLREEADVDIIVLCWKCHRAADAERVRQQEARRFRRRLATAARHRGWLELRESEMF